MKPVSRSDKRSYATLQHRAKPLVPSAPGFENLGDPTESGSAGRTDDSLDLIRHVRKRLRRIVGGARHRVDRHNSDGVGETVRGGILLLLRNTGDLPNRVLPMVAASRIIVDGTRFVPALPRWIAF